MTENGSTAASRNALLTKLKSLDELSEIAAKMRSDGEITVLAHGTFDLLHVGHLRHLREAKSNGTKLFVTLTADAFVNKGPGRPVFSEHMRAEMIAALECVDYVGINHGPKAIEVIEAIKPKIYIKGSDYKKPSDDITGGIVEERRAVIANGGKTVFTEDVTFSSSNLINRHLGVFDPTLGEYLEAQREIGILDDMLGYIKKAENLKVLMIGDAIIDEYLYVSPLGKSPKENMIATLFENREVFAGGIFAAANHVADFCKDIEVVTTIGADCPYEETIRRSLRPNVKFRPYKREGAPTTRKTRYIDQTYLRKMFEVYDMDDTPTSPELERDIDKYLAENADKFDLVIVTDFGHGCITPSLIATLERTAKFLAVNTQSNSANLGFNLVTKYKQADYICIDAPEARLATADKLTPVEELISEKLANQVSSQRIMVTHGKNGCVGYDRGNAMVRVPAFTKTVVDTVGAGDAFFVVTAPLAAVGAPVSHLAFVGNAAGAIKVGIVGHRDSVEKVPLIKFLTTLLK